VDGALADVFAFKDASMDGATASSSHADRASFRRTDVIRFWTSTVTPVALSFKSMSSKRAWPRRYTAASYDLLPGAYRATNEEKRREGEGLAKGIPSASRAMDVWPKWCVRSLRRREDSSAFESEKMGTVVFVMMEELADNFLGRG